MDEETHEDNANNWTEISIIFDRFFFLLVFLLTSASTLYCLIIAPNLSQPSLHTRKWEQ